VSALGLTSGILGGDIHERARNAGRSRKAQRLLALIGFLTLPTSLVVAFLAQGPIHVNDETILIAIAILIFVATHAGLRALANPSDAFTPWGFASSFAIVITSLIVSVGDLFIAGFVLFRLDSQPVAWGIALLLATFAVRLGWRIAKFAHRRKQGGLVDHD